MSKKAVYLTDPTSPNRPEKREEKSNPSGGVGRGDALRVLHPPRGLMHRFLQKRNPVLRMPNVVHKVSGPSIPASTGKNVGQEGGETRILGKPRRDATERGS